MHWECCFASLSVTLLLRCRDCFWKILIASSNSFVQLSTKHTQSGFSKVEYLSLTTSLQPKKTKFSNFAPVVRSSQVHWFFAIWRGDRKGPQGHRVNCHLSPPCLPLQMEESAVKCLSQGHNNEAYGRPWTRNLTITCPTRYHHAPRCRQ